jgi:hypothetical protein
MQNTITSPKQKISDIDYIPHTSDTCGLIALKILADILAILAQDAT